MSSRESSEISRERRSFCKLDTKPWTVFGDIRIARRFQLSERMSLDGIVDVFNIVNRFNVADVSPLYSSAGTPTAAFDPRQFQFALRLSW